MWLRITLFIAVISNLMTPAMLYGQSLSDIQWDQFVADKGREDDVRTHTDPFSSGASAAEDLSVEELQLSGIAYYDENDACALISGYLVRPGDRIAGYRVDAVERDKVRLRRVDDVFVLVLGGGI